MLPTADAPNRMEPPSPNVTGIKIKIIIRKGPDVSPTSVSLHEVNRQLPQNPRMEDKHPNGDEPSRNAATGEARSEERWGLEAIGTPARKKLRTNRTRSEDIPHDKAVSCGCPSLKSGHEQPFLHAGDKELSDLRSSDCTSSPEKLKAAPSLSRLGVDACDSDADVREQNVNHSDQVFRASAAPRMEQVS